MVYGVFDVSSHVLGWTGWVFVFGVCRPSVWTMTTAATHDAVLRVGYIGVSALCVQMIIWIWFAPGSCTLLRSALRDEMFSSGSNKFVPSNLVLKYRKHFAVCATHVLPASVWCALIPFQLHPNARKQYMKLHRITGRVFFAVGACMTYGYYLIHKRGLHFHMTDFPTLPGDASISFVFDYAKVGMSFVHFEHAGAVWFAYTLVRAFTAVAVSRDFMRHRVWTWRHVAAGLAVALQRVFIFFHHMFFTLAYGHGYSHVPEIQKPIFADSLVYGGLVAVLYCEACVWRVSPRKSKHA